MDTTNSATQPAQRRRTDPPPHSSAIAADGQGKPQCNSPSHPAYKLQPLRRNFHRVGASLEIGLSALSTLTRPTEVCPKVNPNLIPGLVPALRSYEFHRSWHCDRDGFHRSRHCDCDTITLIKH